MQSGNQGSFPDRAARQSAPPAAVEYRRLLKEVFWVSRGWSERVAKDDPWRATLIYLGILADDLVRANDYSASSLATVRALLCTSCRRLEAARVQCAGKSLTRCRLLIESGAVTGLPPANATRS